MGLIQAGALACGSLAPGHTGSQGRRSNHAKSNFELTLDLAVIPLEDDKFRKVNIWLLQPLDERLL
ncbi:MAG TPA: hypothetical protein VLA52_04930 [Thermohalobaculum sp.]|nr:hypothetical protein [Thermohalobaculum sp.]